METRLQAQKAQQENNLIEQLRVIIAEKEEKIKTLQEEILPIKVQVLPFIMYNAHWGFIVLQYYFLICTQHFIIHYKGKYRYIHYSFTCIALLFLFDTFNIQYTLYCSVIMFIVMTTNRYAQNFNR